MAGGVSPDDRLESVFELLRAKQQADVDELDRIALEAEVGYEDARASLDKVTWEIVVAYARSEFAEGLLRELNAPPPRG